jgi:flavin reductase (DIM6/NTAB) family NADH-FMN oxidoreductase RutF
VSSEGRTNLAPFSFFQGITAKPPVVMFVPVDSRDGQKKDTVRNIEQVPEFVVNLVPFELAEKMNHSSAPLPYGESEFEAFGIAAALSERVRPPRVADAPVAFECALHSIVRIGEGPGAANVIFGRILVAHVKDGALGPDGKPDSAKLDLIGRMGGEFYCRTTQRFIVKRPVA